MLMSVWLELQAALKRQLDGANTNVGGHSAQSFKFLRLPHPRTGEHWFILPKLAPITSTTLLRCALALPSVRGVPGTVNFQLCKGQCYRLPALNLGGAISVSIQRTVVVYRT